MEISKENKDIILKFITNYLPLFKADCWGTIELEGDDDYKGNQFIVTGNVGEKRRSFIAVLSTTDFMKHIVLIEESVVLYRSPWK